MTSSREAVMESAERAARAADDAQPAEPRYLRVSRAAELLDCDTRTVYRLISDGRLPAIRIGDRALRINVADLDRLRHDPGRTDRDAAAAASTHPRPRARAPRGRFARKARGLPA